jgi:hypothetical protein
VDALDDGLAQRVAHPRERDVAVLAVDDELADHRVVVGRHHVAGVDVGLDAHAGAAGAWLKSSMRPGLGMKVSGCSALMRHSMAWPRQLMSSWVAQALAAGDEDLLLDDVDAGDHLGDRVLHLDPGVHLDEVELAVLVQELEGADAAVADAAAGRRAALADGACAARR